MVCLHTATMGVHPACFFTDRVEKDATLAWNRAGKQSSYLVHSSLYCAPTGERQAYFSVCLGVPLVGCDRDDVAAPRDSHVMGDGSRPAGDSPDRDDRSADRPEPSIADSSQRDTRAGPEGSLRGAWGAHRDHTSSKNVGAKPAE